MMDVLDGVRLLGCALALAALAPDWVDRRATYWTHKGPQA